MTNEQLRMQMLAGIITESQYKAELKEEDSMGKVGKSFPAPSTPPFVKNLIKVTNDIPQKKIFLGKNPESGNNMDAIFYDDTDSFYNIDKGENIECLNRIPNMTETPFPISEYPDATPLKKFDDLRNLYRILSAFVYGIKIGCPDIFNSEDGQYILIRGREGKGYITHKGEWFGSKQGPKYDLGMGLEFTLLN